MTNADFDTPLPVWFSALCGAVHWWEIVHGGSLEGFPTTKQAFELQLCEDGSPFDDELRAAPGFVLDVGARSVKVTAEGEPTRNIRRLSAHDKSRKHHQVPRMLIRRWANRDGKVLWRRSEWEIGRVAPMNPKKIMRRSNAYSMIHGLDPQVAEDMLADLESVTAETLPEIDELVARPADGQPIRWQGHLEGTQEVLKLFILHQMIRTEDHRRRLEKAFPLDEGVRTARNQATDWTESDTALMELEYRNRIVAATSVVHPDHPWHLSATGPETEIYIGLPDPPGDVFPLTDIPVWFPRPFPFPPGMGRREADAMRTDLGAVAPFLPIGPNVGIGIKPTTSPDDVVKWALIPVDIAMQYCTHLSGRYSEVVLPWKPTNVWDIFGAR